MKAFKPAVVALLLGLGTASADEAVEYEAIVGFVPLTDVRDQVR